MKGFNKKISKSGSITLPSALRREYGLTDGERFSITVDNYDGSIVLRRSEASCIFCEDDTAENLIIFKGRPICADCAGRIGVVLKNAEAERSKNE